MCGEVAERSEKVDCCGRWALVRDKFLERGSAGRGSFSAGILPVRDELALTSLHLNHDFIDSICAMDEDRISLR